nr:hypothetical protein [uncultured Ralstonia sp.]
MKNRHLYFSGALEAQAFLRWIQTDACVHQQFEPTRLRSQINSVTLVQPPAFRAGFIDAIGAFLTLTLEGVPPDPQQWDVRKVVSPR